MGEKNGRRPVVEIILGQLGQFLNLALGIIIHDPEEKTCKKNPELA
jgi:hypothetical protein